MPETVSSDSEALSKSPVFARPLPLSFDAAPIKYDGRLKAGLMQSVVLSLNRYLVRVVL